jgi:hypothetical protein
MSNHLPPPQVSVGTWICVGGSIDAYVLRTYPDGSLKLGYYQNRLKAIGREAVWSGTQWDFKNEGPDGTYLRGREEAIVKGGPQGLSPCIG